MNATTATRRGQTLGHWRDELSRRRVESRLGSRIIAITIVFVLVAAALPGPAEASATVQPSLARWMNTNARTSSDEKTTVWIVESVAGAHAAYLGEDLLADGRLGAIVQLRGTALAFRRLAGDPAISHLGMPPPPLPIPGGPRAAASPTELFRTQGAGAEIVSQGVAAMRRQRMFDLGITGQGIRVGVVDVGFDGYASRQGSELPRTVKMRSFGGSNEPNAHGTACAEIVHDVAPDAELYLAEVSTAVDLQNASEWFIDEGVEVVSHSLAWFLGGGAGDGPIADIVTTAAQAGITWVTSSGNFARAHWSASFADIDADGYLDTNGIEDIALQADNSAPRLVLLWDRWPTSDDLSFRLEIRDGANIVATSELDFEPSSFAYREVASPLPLGDPNFRIRLIEGDPGDVTLRVFRIDGGSMDPTSRIAAGSLAIPADSPRALSVGAFPWSGDGIESFSSYGPTVSGLNKPELLGPDRVSTSVPGFDPFVGTSAACPHVAGAVALHLSAALGGAFFEAHLGSNDVRALLEAAALPAEGPKGSTGWGRVRLNTDPWTVAFPRFDVLGYGSGDGLELRTTAPLALGSAPQILVVDVTGRRVAAVTGRIESGVAAFRLSPSLRLSRGRYWAWWPATAARTGFFWP